MKSILESTANIPPGVKAPFLHFSSSATPAPFLALLASSSLLPSSSRLSRLRLHIEVVFEEVPSPEDPIGGVSVAMPSLAPVYDRISNSLSDSIAEVSGTQGGGQLSPTPWVALRGFDEGLSTPNDPICGPFVKLRVAVPRSNEGTNNSSDFVCGSYAISGSWIPKILLLVPSGLDGGVFGRKSPSGEETRT